MKYTIYKITNRVNGKVYIGKHQTIDINDNYMGSGKLLKRAKEKYGIENFKKEILYVFDTEEEMNAKEAELVTEEFCLREDTYNMCIGGKGGFGYINNNSELKREYSVQSGKASQKAIKEKYGVDNSAQLPHVRLLQSSRAKVLHEQGKIPIPSWKNKKHKDDTKQKMSLSAKMRLSDPKNNSQYGTIWITDGISNKKIKKDVDLIPEGWYKGRTVNVSK